MGAVEWTNAGECEASVACLWLDRTGQYRCVWSEQIIESVHLLSRWFGLCCQGTSYDNDNNIIIPLNAQQAPSILLCYFAIAIRLVIMMIRGRDVRNSFEYAEENNSPSRWSPRRVDICDQAIKVIIMQLIPIDQCKFYCLIKWHFILKRPQQQQIQADFTLPSPSELKDWVVSVVVKCP